MKQCSVWLVLLVATVFHGALLMSWAADEQVIFTQSANGSRSTRPFTVKDGWEIRWDNKGSMLSIAVRTVAGKLAPGGAMATSPGTGSSFVPHAGTFYLDIAGSGDWTITVVQLP